MCKYDLKGENLTPFLVLVTFTHVLVVTFVFTQIEINMKIKVNKLLKTNLFLGFFFFCISRSKVQYTTRSFFFYSTFLSKALI